MIDPLSVCLVNGEPIGSDGVDVGDRGLRYGDGVFETLAIVDHQPTLWQRHLERLQRGAQRLGIEQPDLAQALHADIAQLTLPALGVLRITLTRGSGGAGYAVPDHPAPRRIIQVLPPIQRPAQHWQAGIDVITLTTRLACQPALAGIKHLNRLEQVLGRQEWNDPAIAEGLMVSTQDELIEATAANLLVEHQGELIIPDTQNCGVDGVMQAWLVDQAQQQGARVRRARLEAALPGDHALMLCNSLIGLWPVATIDGQSHPWPSWYAPLTIALEQARIALTPTVMRCA